MDDLAHDTEIGPELIVFLTQKVKATKEALNVSMKENEDLRKEIARLRDESRSESSSKESAEDEVANTTCQSGQCKSRDEANAFRIELIEALERLKARELAVRDALEQAHEFKLKYGDAMIRVKQQQKTIDELKERLRQMLHTTDQPELSDPSSSQLPVPNHEDDTPPHSSKYIQMSHNLEPLDDYTLELIKQPCMPSGMSPSSVPKHIKNLMCEGGVIYWSERSLVDHVSGSAILWACKNRYRHWITDEQQRWLPSKDLTGLKDKRREFFYKQDGEIFYAGTFQSPPTIFEYAAEEYQVLPEDLRKSLLASCFMPTPPNYPKVSEAERTAIADMFWRGEAKIECLCWKRIDFNLDMFNELYALRTLQKPPVGDESGEPEVARPKRKNSQDHEVLSWRKKIRSEEDTESDSL